MFHPAMSFENDSDYRALENFENSSFSKSDGPNIAKLPESQSQHIEQKVRNLAGGSGFPQSESDQVVPTYANELERKQLQ